MPLPWDKSVEEDPNKELSEEEKRRRFEEALKNRGLKNGNIGGAGQDWRLLPGLFGFPNKPFQMTKKKHPIMNRVSRTEHTVPIEPIKTWNLNMSVFSLINITLQI